MYLFFSAVMTALLLLSGCTSKSEKTLIDTFNQKKDHYRKLIKTEKVQFYDKNVTKILLTATYLGESDDGKEVFIVGIYRDDDLLDRSLGDLLHLSLNGRSPIETRMLEHQDKRLKELPLLSPWLDYYQLKFPHVAQKRLVMKVITDRYGRAELHFAKIAKYMLEIIK